MNTAVGLHTAFDNALQRCGRVHIVAEPVAVVAAAAVPSTAAADATLGAGHPVPEEGSVEQHTVQYNSMLAI